MINPKETDSVIIAISKNGFFFLFRFALNLIRTLWKKVCGFVAALFNENVHSNYWFSSTKWKMEKKNRRKNSISTDKSVIIDMRLHCNSIYRFEVYFAMEKCCFNNFITFSILYISNRMWWRKSKKIQTRQSKEATLQTFVVAFIDNSR